MHDVPSARPERPWIAGLALAALACAAFARAVPGELVLDDLAFLAANPRLAAVSNPLVLFGARVWDFSNVAGADVPLYRPVFMVALWAGARLLGEHAWAWHVAVVLLHAANAVLVWLLCRRLLPDAAPLAALSAAIVFAVHPVHAEAVAWILGCTHALASLLALGAAHAALANARRDRPAALLAACVLSAAAMLTSEGAFAVPPLLVALDWVIRRRVRVPVAAAHVAFALAVLAMRWRVAGAGVPLAGGGAGVPVAADFLAGYLRQLVVPWPQPLFLSLPRGGVSTPLGWGIAAAALLASAFLVRRAPAGSRAVPLLALGWIAVSLVPLAAAALNPRPLFAPRALYLASVGLALLVGWLLRDVAAARPRATWAAVGLLAAAGIGVSDAAATGWTSNAIVYARAVAADPASVGLRVKLAELHAQRGDGAGAESHYRAAVGVAAATGDRSEALESFAAYLATSGRLDEAERAMQEAVSLTPSRSSAWVGLGNVAFARGDAAAARARYERAVELDASNYEAASNLALACEAAGGAGACSGYRERAASLRAGAGVPR